MSERSGSGQRLNPAVVAGWTGVVFAAIGVIGLLFAPSLQLVWIVLLFFAAGAVPQTLAARRREGSGKR